MSIEAAYALPHPPLAIPEIGKGKERGIKKTIDAYNRAAGEIAEFAPETIIFITPHSVMYADYFHISPQSEAEGDLSRFGAPGVRFKQAYDEQFIAALCEDAEKAGISAGTLGERDNTLDHGVMVPLYFINKYYQDYKMIRIAISDMELSDHYDLGIQIAKTADRLNKKVIFIATGDMSHKLKEDGPYGYDSEGPIFDALVIDAFETAQFDKLLSIPDIFAERAAECGLKGFVTLAGTLHKKAVKARVYSYEGITGVGYGIASFIVENDDESRDFPLLLKRKQLIQISEKKEREDKYVRLARYIVEAYITTGRVPDIPEDLPEEMYEKRAGVFVSIKKANNLRGCVGTIVAVYNNIAEEIRANAISAAVGDSRFLPVSEDELPLLSYSVDILMELEEIPPNSKHMLDVQKYGIVVRNKFKKGLLLPNLDNVNTIDEQISIAKKKAGIGEHEDFSIERFEVVRHK